MWKCHKCGKPVYFAERKQSLGYDWHPECLRCEECGKRLDPGQHAEHKGVPYCHVPCYGALFGPQLFGHGTRVESHKSFGQKGSARVSSGPPLPRSHLESKLKIFNQYYEGKSHEIKSREVNGRLVLEGALRIHWGVQGVIHLKEDDDQRTVVTVRKRNSVRFNNGLDEEKFSDNEEDELSITENNISDVISISDTGIESGSDTTDISNSSLNLDSANLKCFKTLPPKLDVKNLEWDELDELLQVERKVDDSEKLYQTMPTPLPSKSHQSNHDNENMVQISSSNCDDDNLLSKDAQITIDRENNSVDKIQNDINESEKLLKELPSRSLIKDDSWIEKGLMLNRSMSGPDCLERNRKSDLSDCDTLSDDSGNHDTFIDPSVQLRKPPKTGSTAIRRRSGKRRSRTKIKRRCSINGHFYNRETSFFTPPHGSHMSVWITSLVNTQEVINLMLEKYKVDSDPNNFALFVIRDNGEQRKLRADEYPLLVRVLLGPHEDVCKIFIMDRHTTPEVSNAVAQFLNLSLPECQAILEMYKLEEQREIKRIQEKFIEMRKRIKQRTEELKVRL